MAKRREVQMRWFAEADAADNFGKTLPANGTVVTVLVPTKPKAGFPFREVRYNGATFVGNTAHLTPVN